MHKEISTRTAEQCRSHHQKKIQRHGTIEEIVRDYEVTKEKKERKQAEEAGRFKRKRRTKA